MSDDPHHAFRARIDELTDQRDKALQQAAKVPKLRARIYQLEKSLSLWRLRARQERAKR
jgi:hypothetical protein